MSFCSGVCVWKEVRRREKQIVLFCVFEVKTDDVHLDNDS